MEKNRILLFFVLSLAILYGSRFLLPTPPKEPPKEVTPAKVENTQPAETPSPKPVVPPVQAEVAQATESTEILDIHGDEARDIVIADPLYVATLSNVGGVLKSFKLKEYKDGEGGPLELVDGRKALELGWPLSISSGSEARDKQLNNAVFKAQRDGKKVVFEWAGDGLYSKKQYEFNPETYTFSIGSDLAVKGAVTPHRLSWRGFGDKEVDSTGILCWIGLGSCDETTRHAVVDITPDPKPGEQKAAAKFERVQPQPAKEKAAVQGPVIEKTTRRAGMEDQFFLLMMSLSDPAVFNISRERVADETEKMAGLISVSAPAQGKISIYAGPKDRAVLEKAEPGLGEVINYGFFWFLTEPLARALMWLHGFIGNFGWSIVLLTCAINFSLFPLRIRQQLSMQKLQKIQPKMRTLQDKFKKLKAGDPRRAEIQAEIMNLYKENGVNPVGGCFPLLLQFPFLIAFYNVLSSTIQLRRAPWILWIQDLSHRDPYFVMPLLMAASMLIMQRMTPTSVDPQQARMMMIMPLLMVLMFLAYPSGLMLYWLTSNLIGIGQQVFITKFWSPSEGEARA
ncbi:MAG TPA: membrane protein insertase YidC [Terriglobia bacterium]|nr:membrane protein insertase YidC [Terriglobia bacterium]